MEKSPEAFRTISEVAEWLDVPTHVLRFWESRFAQVKPVKRAGGRRYYRPSDMRLIGGIKKLLHEDGMTIRGVQRLLREEGVKYVSAYSRPLDSDLIDETTLAEMPSFRHAAPAEAAPEPEVAAAPEVVVEPEPEAPVEPEPPFEPAPAPEPEVAFDAPAAPEPEPEVVPEPEFTPEEPETVVQFDSIRREPEPAETAEADMPELPFIGSARDHPRPVDAELASEPEVFIEPEPEPAPPAPSIPPTPDVPAHDAADDAPEHARGASVGARLIAASNRSLMDIGVMAEAAAALRAVRDRTQP
ncbi:MAG: MerR family transcriptional regulator [Pseudomonadota bacterium]